MYFDETMAAVCFSLGVVTGLRGITHDFPITIEQWMQFMSSTNVGTLPIAILTGVREMVQLYVLNFIKLLSL